MPYYQDGSVTIWNGDCKQVLQSLRANSLDACVTDPPYHLVSQDKRDHRRASPAKSQRQKIGGFMGMKWDGGDIAHTVELWRDIFRVLKPGAHLVAFAGTRTYHRMACAIEDAGFEIRDQIGWIYGSGFPKSLDVSKAIDKAAGAKREIVGVNRNGSGAHLTKLQNHGDGDTGIGYMDGSGKVFDVTEPATPEAKQWQGWGTALKPAWEPIVLARKPLIGTVVENVQKFGTGAINIDDCRVAIDPTVDDPRLGGNGDWSSDKMAKNVYEGGYAGVRVGSSEKGRWPANIVHDGSDEVLAAFPSTESGKPCGIKSGNNNKVFGQYAGGISVTGFGDFGNASRFFYCAKASSDERFGDHPTVKPLALMQWLVRLICPVGGTLIDPFMGSGTTLCAAKELERKAIGIEIEERYCKIAERRVEQEILPLNAISNPLGEVCNTAVT